LGAEGQLALLSPSHLHRFLRAELLRSGRTALQSATPAHFGGCLADWIDRRFRLDWLAGWGSGRRLVDDGLGELSDIARTTPTRSDMHCQRGNDSFWSGKTVLQPDEL